MILDTPEGISRNITYFVQNCLSVLSEGSDQSLAYGQTTHSSHRIPVVRNLMITLCTFFSVTGATFNLTLISALLKYRRQTLQDNITNLFVLCLSVSDIFLCSVSMPVQMMYEINEYQLASTGLCRVLFAGFGLPLNISCLTILLIAFDRYRMIVHPMKMQMSRSVALSLIGLVILFGGVNSIPVALHVGVDQMTNYTYCVERWPSPRLRFIYSVCVFLVCFALPLAVSGGFYLAIYCRLSRQSTQLGFRKEAERRKRRTTSLLVATVVCFALCWTSWCIYSLLLEWQSLMYSLTASGRLTNHPTVKSKSKFERKKCETLLFEIAQQLDSTNVFKLTEQQAKTEVYEIIPGRHLKLVDLICKVIAMSSTCVNPFIYGWLNEPIQKIMCRQYGRVTECLKRSKKGEADRGITFQSECTRTKPDLHSVLVMDAALNGDRATELGALMHSQVVAFPDCAKSKRGSER